MKQEHLKIHNYFSIILNHIIDANRNLSQMELNENSEIKLSIRTVKDSS